MAGRSLSHQLGINPRPSAHLAQTVKLHQGSGDPLQLLQIPALVLLEAFGVIIAGVRQQPVASNNGRLLKLLFLVRKKKKYTIGKNRRVKVNSKGWVHRKRGKTLVLRNIQVFYRFTWFRN